MTTRNTQDNSMLNAALAYARDGRLVIPLIGKKPLVPHGYKDGTKDPTQIIEWWQRWPHANVGLVTGAASDLFILDVDVKKGHRGDESLRALEAQFDKLPVTRLSRTASGGWHYYFRMSAQPIKSRKGVRDGIDLLAEGSYIVAPPSTVEGMTYQWVNESELATSPNWLAELGQPNQASLAQVENRIPNLIRDLFPTGRESNGNLMVHCLYHDDSTPSMGVRLEDGLFHCFTCEARGSLEDLYVKVTGASPEEARRLIHPMPAFVDELNREHAVVTDFGGKCVVLNEGRDPIHGWTSISFSSQADLKLRYQNRTVVLGEKRICVADAWFRHRDRREYRQIVFAPGRSTPGHYNLWQGFPITPKPGKWDLLQEHIHDNICRKDQGLYRYLMAWMAQTIQLPWERPGTAIVLRGKQGTGKGILCSQFGALFGPHFTHVTNPRHLVGNFNAHLKHALLVFADEAYWAGDKASEGVLKALITEKTLPVEYKGKDVVHVENYVRLMIATNNEWAVPAGLEERRFCVIDVGEGRMQDTSFFKRLVEQMENGGREAFLHALSTYDLSTVNLRQLPQTEALMETKLMTMGTAELFWYEILARGGVCDGHWESSIAKEGLHKLFVDYAKAVGLSRRSTETMLGMTLKKLCPHIKDVKIGSLRGWEVGSLARCREAFDRVMLWVGHEWEADSEVSDHPADDLSVDHEPRPIVQPGPIEEYPDMERFADLSEHDDDDSESGSPIAA